MSHYQIAIYFLSEGEGGSVAVYHNFVQNQLTPRLGRTTFLWPYLVGGNSYWVWSSCTLHPALHKLDVSANDFCEVSFGYLAYFALALVGWCLPRLIRHNSGGGKEETQYWNWLLARRCA